MIIKKKRDFDPIVKEKEDRKGMKYYPMLTPKDGTPNFSMRLIELKPGGYTPKHRHDFEHEAYVIVGNGFLVIDEVKTKVEKDDFILVNLLELHQFEAGEFGMNLICVVPNKGQY